MEASTQFWVPQIWAALPIGPNISSVPFPAIMLDNYDNHIDDIFNIFHSLLTSHNFNNLYLHSPSTALRQLHRCFVFTLKYWTLSDPILYFLENLNSTTFLFVSLFSKDTSPSEDFTSHNSSLDPQGPSYYPNYH